MEGEEAGSTSRASQNWKNWPSVSVSGERDCQSQRLLRTRGGGVSVSVSLQLNKTRSRKTRGEKKQERRKKKREEETRTRPSDIIQMRQIPQPEIRLQRVYLRGRPVRKHLVDVRYCGLDVGGAVGGHVFEDGLEVGPEVAVRYF